MHEITFESFVERSRVSANENVSIPLSYASVKPETTAGIVGELSNDRMRLLNSDGGTVVNVKGLPRDIIKLNLFLPANYGMPPEVTAGHMTDDSFRISIIDHVTFTQRHPLELLVTRSGPVDAVVGEHAEKVISIATQRNKKYPWYNRFLYPHPGAKVIVFTGGTQAVYRSKSGPGSDEMLTQVVEFIRSSWNHTMVKNSRLARLLETVPGIRYEQTPYTGDFSRTKTYIVENGSVAFVSMENGGYLNAAESMGNSVVLSTARSARHRRILVTDTEQVTVFDGKANDFGEVTPTTRLFGTDDIAHAIVEGDRIRMIHPGDTEIPGVPVLFNHLTVQSSSGRFSGIVIHDQKLYDTIHWRAIDERTTI